MKQNIRTGFITVLLLISACSGSPGGPGSSNNPSVTPIISANGGTAQSADRRALITIPAGALSQDISITVEAASNPLAGGLGTVYHFGPDGTVFQVPVTVTVNYDPATLPPGADESSIVLATIMNGQWVPLADSQVNAGANTVTATTIHFSNYGAIPAGPSPFDFDGDGIANASDNCPSVINADQADGDADKTGDLCDNCPVIPNEPQGDQDLDLRGDVCDNCVSFPNYDQADLNLDGIGDTCADGLTFETGGDPDGDGIPNAQPPQNNQPLGPNTTPGNGGGGSTAGGSGGNGGTGGSGGSTGGGSGQSPSEVTNWTYTETYDGNPSPPDGPVIVVSTGRCESFPDPSSGIPLVERMVFTVTVNRPPNTTQWNNQHITYTHQGTPACPWLVTNDMDGITSCVDNPFIGGSPCLKRSSHCVAEPFGVAESRAEHWGANGVTHTDWLSSSHFRTHMCEGNGCNSEMVNGAGIPTGFTQNQSTADCACDWIFYQDGSCLGVPPS